MPIDHPASGYGSAGLFSDADLAETEVAAAQFEAEWKRLQELQRVIGGLGGKFPGLQKQFAPLKAELDELEAKMRGREEVPSNTLSETGNRQAMP